MNIRPENTAITTGISKSTFELEKNTEKNARILDYGSGRLRNAKYLSSKGLNVSVLDTDFQIQRTPNEELIGYENVFTVENYEPSENFDSVLCSFVLNVIPTIEERNRTLDNIHRSLKDDGQLFLEVRGHKGIQKNKFKEPYNDGFAVGRNQVKTFQKPYSKDDVTDLLKERFEVCKVKALSDSIFAVAKKKKGEKK